MLNKYDSYVITCLDFKKRIIHMSRLLNSGQVHCGSHNYYLANKSPKLLTQPWPWAMRHINHSYFSFSNVGSYVDIFF